MKPRHVTVLLMIALGAVLAPLVATAQAPTKVARIGWMSRGNPTASDLAMDASRQGMRELGWVDGQNVTVEYRYAEGKAERSPDLATELVHLPVEVIVAGPAPAAVAAKQAPTTIPIVITLGADPVAFGLMESLTPQGGNITGLTEMAPELTRKRLTLIKEIMPALTRVAILCQPGMLRAETFGQMVKQAKDTAQALGLQLQFVEVQAANDLDAAFDAMAKEHVEALIRHFQYLSRSIVPRSVL